MLQDSSLAPQERKKKIESLPHGLRSPVAMRGPTSCNNTAYLPNSYRQTCFPCGYSDQQETLRHSRGSWPGNERGQPAVEEDFSHQDFMSSMSRRKSSSTQDAGAPCIGRQSRFCLRARSCVLSVTFGDVGDVRAVGRGCCGRVV
ncbi:hypothetical protein BaRGS_00000144 [Batillaria attramentaria]|uniref:Uncharacterized protein n=1 Tax=Batillaria attramentaria TaxID=370345 RepID=A0ABD0MCE8_9CAEN